MNIDRTTVGKIELAACGVSLDLLFALSDLLNVPIDRLFVLGNKPMFAEREHLAIIDLGASSFENSFLKVQGKTPAILTYCEAF